MKKFEYSSDMDENGILYYLGTKAKTASYKNPCELGVVAVTANVGTYSDSQPIQCFVGRETVRGVLDALDGGYFCVDFKGYRILNPTKYTLKHYVTQDVHALRKWVLEASPDGKEWTVLKQHYNDSALSRSGATFSWSIECSDTKTLFRYVRVKLTGYNSSSAHHLCCSGFEIYASLFDPDAEAKKLKVKCDDGHLMTGYLNRPGDYEAPGSSQPNTTDCNTCEKTIKYDVQLFYHCDTCKTYDLCQKCAKKQPQKKDDDTDTKDDEKKEEKKEDKKD